MLARPRATEWTDDAADCPSAVPLRPGGVSRPDRRLVAVVAAAVLAPLTPPAFRVVVGEAPCIGRRRKRDGERWDNVVLHRVCWIT